MDLGLKIKKIRTKRKISQIQFAKDIGISRGALSNYERGLRIPPINVLITISKKFNINIEELTDNSTIDSNEYIISDDEAKLLKESNLVSETYNTDFQSINFEDLINFLNKSGYPINGLTTEQLIELHKDAKNFFNYEFFKMGYLRISRD